MSRPPSGQKNHRPALRRNLELRDRCELEEECAPEAGQIFFTRHLPAGSGYGSMPTPGKPRGGPFGGVM